jgi:organic radical activating enzyme
MKKLKDLELEVDENGKVFQYKQNFIKVVDGINSVSPSFCLAKFTQVTLHLGTGMVHSCHHPTTHKIPVDMIAKNPEILFNTPHLQEARSQMLDGVRPSECDYCWRIEDNGNKSDRMFKSTADWAISQYDNIVESKKEDFFKPTYVEVSFGNTCNLKCNYCSPEFSSKWVDELKQHGPIKLVDQKNKIQWVHGWQDLDSLSIPNKDYNPYVDAFWKWFPEIYPTLQHYRITGGEPLLNKNTLRSLDYIIENPKKDLELSINTNLSVPDKVWKNFLEKIIKLEQQSNFKKITIYTSVESWKEKAEYSRYGLDFNLLKERFEELLQKTSVRCVVMSTYNMLSITSFEDVLKWILELKQKYNYNHKRSEIFEKTGYDIRLNDSKKTNHSFRVGIDIPYLRHPEFFDVQYSSDELVEKYMLPALDFMSRNVGVTDIKMHLGFEPYEVEKFERIVKNRIKNGNSESVLNAIASQSFKFYDFINELDKRRNTDFLKTFPEMEEFYNKCKYIRENIE